MRERVGRSPSADAPPPVVLLRSPDLHKVKRKKAREREELGCPFLRCRIHLRKPPAEGRTGRKKKKRQKKSYVTFSQIGIVSRGQMAVNNTTAKLKKEAEEERALRKSSEATRNKAVQAKIEAIRAKKTVEENLRKVTEERDNLGGELGKLRADKRALETEVERLRKAAEDAETVNYNQMKQLGDEFVNLKNFYEAKIVELGGTIEGDDEPAGEDEDVVLEDGQMKIRVPDAGGNNEVIVDVDDINAIDNALKSPLPIPDHQKPSSQPSSPRVPNPNLTQG